jgi:ABC transporter substrate binding protein
VVARLRVPAMYQSKEFAHDGGLMAYLPSVAEQAQRAADYVDRSLKGTRPGDLPIDQPARFELVINLKTAKALGLTIPPSLLLRADRVIADYWLARLDHPISYTRDGHPHSIGWGILASRYVGQTIRPNIGRIQLSDRYVGEFSATDEAGLVDFARVAQSRSRTFGGLRAGATPTRRRVRP